MSKTLICLTIKKDKIVLKEETKTTVKVVAKVKQDQVDPAVLGVEAFPKEVNNKNNAKLKIVKRFFVGKLNPFNIKFFAVTMSLMLQD